MFFLKNRTSLIFITILLFSNIFVWQIVYDLSEGQYLKVVFFDVGQGDAIFIETPTDKQILIDGGLGSTVLEKLGKEMPSYDRTLDLIILTHPEKDHMSGLLEVLKRYKIRNILWTGIVRDTVEWQEWVDLIQKEGAEIKIAKAGDKIILQRENPLIFIDILSPEEGLEGKEFENSNDTSIVFSLIAGYKSFLFTGDIGNLIEKELPSKQIDVDVLKVAHHGSKYSTSEDFLEKTSPTAAVITVGDNNYGHPTPEVLQRLGNFGITIFNTKENGDIKIISDGENLKFVINGN
ncbi:MBL fold metallo-hydrolase [Patescibacteria group bacterium]|nr:MBL fold metallo-hydrolase [Patescibacteria group bacterium]MBU4367274.1 MBL fold metallo-hydrolase [Patescibacteria group bacterium]MBU4462009.1 MBL fold metallo-hydrolase [Patescibacteria group bacterium]MCG2700200.1 MBL fold metallo-hydrolase [Candidatus Parcubacteria bacterium]